MVHEFHESGKQVIQKCQSELMKKAGIDYGDIRSKLHTFKGNVGTIGAIRLFNCVFLLIKAVEKDQVPENIKSGLDKTSQELEFAVQSLTERVNEMFD